MKSIIVWLPLLELVIGALVCLPFARKFKEVAFLYIVQIVLYVVLMNGVFLIAYLAKQ
ncbi:hypothetical protein ACQCN2_18945 [Brevibacillus ginsengisoli]|uniref:hypothetical protein n=1 Tax=Brevibacillus ginsengisoli TaxID=363854 RepID=UPI003CF68411